MQRQPLVVAFVRRKEEPGYSVHYVCGAQSARGLFQNGGTFAPLPPDGATPITVPSVRLSTPPVYLLRGWMRAAS